MFAQLAAGDGSTIPETNGEGRIMDEMLEIGPGAAGEADELLVLYAAVQEAVAGTDNDPQWIIGEHPSRGQLTRAAEAGELFVARAGRRLAAAFILDREGAPGYGEVPWRVEAVAGEYGVVHLLAVHPDFRGRGLARHLMDAAKQAARERGLKALRLDTLVDNYGAQRTYERLGFTHFGPVHLTYGTYIDTEAPRFVMYERAVR